MLRLVDHKVITISTIALIVAALLTANGLMLAFDEQRDAAIQNRDAAQVALNARFDIARVRAVGELATFALTQNEDHLGEAGQALAHARAALTDLRATLGDTPTTEGLESQHLGFIVRQRRALAQVEHGFATVLTLGSKTDPATQSHTLDAVFA